MYTKHPYWWTAWRSTLAETAIFWLPFGRWPFIMCLETFSQSFQVNSWMYIRVRSQQRTSTFLSTYSPFINLLFDTIQGVSKILGQILGCVSNTETSKKVCINICPQILKFSRYNAIMYWPYCLNFHLRGQFKPLQYLSLIKNKEMLNQSIKNRL
jgi:hypothetical protein